MNIPFGDCVLTKKSKRLIVKILDSNRLTCGKYVREFEVRFAELIGVKEAVAVSSGTDADALALAVLYDLGAKRGDEIILPALSFAATGNAVLQAGFKPVFVDVRRDTLNIDSEKIAGLITKSTRAIMPVHLMGKPAEMDAINKIARKSGIYVIADAAEAHGALYKGRNVGAVADISAYSLYVAHIITTIEGGIVTTDNADFAEILRSLRAHGRACKCASCRLNVGFTQCSKRFDRNDNSDSRFIFERVGFSAKMNEIEAAVGLGDLGIYDRIIEKRRDNLYYLMRKIEKYGEFLTTINKEPYEEIGPHALPLILQERAGFSREQLVSFLRRRGIDSRTLFSSMPTQCGGFKYLGYKPGDFPNAEYIGSRGIHLGINRTMGKKECDYFLSSLDLFLTRNKRFAA